MVTYANQKVITSKKEEISFKNSKKLYMVSYVDAIEQAATKLTPVAFKLYIYFLNNQRNYIGAFSSADFCARYGCNTRSVPDAMAKLVEQGYLVETSSNHYDFYDYPIVGETLEIITEEKRKFKTKDKVVELTYNELIAALGNNEEAAAKAWASAEGKGE